MKLWLLCICLIVSVLILAAYAQYNLRTVNGRHYKSDRASRKFRVLKKAKKHESKKPEYVAVEMLETRIVQVKQLKKKPK